MRVRIVTWLLAAAAVLGLGGAALAGQPEAWQLGFQPAASPVKAFVDGVHNLILAIITLITLFVLGLLVYASWRFRADRNPTPSRRSHNTLLEILWTAVPVLILVIIAIPSFRLLYYKEIVPEHEMTIKAIGYTWFWDYEYPDHGNFTFTANMVPDDELEPGQPRLLETDNRVVVPVGTNIRVLVTGDPGGVIHAWAVPAFGVKIDAVPGRLNETWIHVERPGVYYGQCSELCGVGHAFMPIAVEAVTREEFEAWVEDAQGRFPVAGGAAIEVAQEAHGR